MGPVRDIFVQRNLRGRTLFAHQPTLETHSSVFLTKLDSNRSHSITFGSVDLLC